jgi:hypothetical protein
MVSWVIKETSSLCCIVAAEKGLADDQDPRPHPFGDTLCPDQLTLCCLRRFFTSRALTETSGDPTLRDIGPIHRWDVLL